MINIYNSINDCIFDSIKQEFKDNNLSDISAAYVSCLLEEKKLDTENNSIIVLYNEIINEPTFNKYQSLGDTCLFREIMFNTNDLNIHFGKVSYYQCYKYTMYKLELYRELSNNFFIISSITRNKIFNVEKLK